MGAHFDALTVNYQDFVCEYIKTGNLSKSAVAAGSTAKNLSQAGAQILKRKEVTASVSEMTTESGQRAAAKLDVTVERVLLEMARIGFADLRKLFDSEGNPKPVHRLDEDTAAAISSMDVLNTNDGVLTKVRTFDKRGPLESLGKHLGMFEKDNEQKQYQDKSLDELKAERREKALRLVGKT